MMSPFDQPYTVPPTLPRDAVAGRHGRARAERNHDRRRRLPRALRGVRGRILGRRVELGEELIGGGLALALASPDHAAAAVIGDQRQVPVSLAPGDLVDRDLKQIAEPVLVELLVGDTLDDPPDRVPVDPGQPDGRGRVALGHQPRDEILKISGEPGAVAGERDAFHQRAVLGAAQASEPGVDLQAPDPEIEVAPDRVVMLLALAMTRAV